MRPHKYKMGIIGNCSYLAYIDDRADVKWMCMPRFDSSFLFGSLLDEEKGGHFFIRPMDDTATSAQYYVPNTNVLCTEFKCRDGRFVVKDCAPRMRIRPPTDAHTGPSGEKGWSAAAPAPTAAQGYPVAQ